MDDSTGRYKNSHAWNIWWNPRDGKKIYCLKIFLLRSELKLNNTNEHALNWIYVFIIEIYIKLWCMTTNGYCAALNDVYFIRELYECKTDNTKINESCLSKFLNHWWYLNKKYIIFFVFNKRISFDVWKNYLVHF